MLISNARAEVQLQDQAAGQRTSQLVLDDEGAFFSTHIETATRTIISTRALRLRVSACVRCAASANERTAAARAPRRGPGPQLNFLFRDFNHHLLVGGGGRLGGAGGAERDRSCTELGINYLFFGRGGEHFPDFLHLTKTFVYELPLLLFRCVNNFEFFCVLTPHLLFAT